MAKTVAGGKWAWEAGVHAYDHAQSVVEKAMPALFGTDPSTRPELETPDDTSLKVEPGPIEDYEESFKVFIAKNTAKDSFTTATMFSAVR